MLFLRESRYRQLLDRIDALERQARVQELTFQEVYEKTLRLFQRIVKRAERSEDQESIPRHSQSPIDSASLGQEMIRDPISEMLLKRRNRSVVKLPTDEQG